MNNKQRNIILVSTLVLLASLAVIYLFLASKRKDTLDQQTTLQADVKTKTDKLQHINDIKIPLQDLSTTVTQLSLVGLPKGAQIPDLIEEVEQTLLGSDPFKSGDFRITAFDPGVGSNGGIGTVGASGLTETVFILTLKGNADKISGVFDALNTNIRPFYVQSITLVPDNTLGAAPNSITATLTMKTFSMPDAVTAAAVAATP